MTQANSSAVRYARSQDGTHIAFQSLGAGPPVILVGGAFNDRNAPAAGLPLAQLLAPHLTVFVYDRRGRGESGGTAPYSVAREIEDLGALMREVGRPASLYGMSSGAALVLEATAAGANGDRAAIERIALFEPPFNLDTAAQSRTKQCDHDLNRLIASGKPDEAVEVFMTHVGMPPQAIEHARQAPMWPYMRGMAPTLIYDYAVLNAAAGAPVPTQRLGDIHVPALVISGGASPAWMRETAQAVSTALPKGSLQTLPGQTHNVAFEALAPVLISFLTQRSACNVPTGEADVPNINKV